MVQKLNYSFPLNNGAGGKYVAPWRAVGQEEPWLSPEDDPDAKRGIPIFRPTMEEFKVSCIPTASCLS